MRISDLWLGWYVIYLCLHVERRLCARREIWEVRVLDQDSGGATDQFWLARRLDTESIRFHLIIRGGVVWVEIATLALYIPFCTCLKASQRHVRSLPSVLESCNGELRMGVFPLVVWALQKHVSFLPPAKESANRWDRWRMVWGFSTAFFWQAFFPFWRYLNLLPFGLERYRVWVGRWSHIPFMQSCLSFHPSLPSFLFSFLSLSLLTSSPFVQRFLRQHIVFPLAISSCSLVHKKETKAISRERSKEGGISSSQYFI